jgi:DNA-binding PucR family transcriptional regulator
VETLGAFACGASRGGGGGLHVHANTVAQRLDRIGMLMGADWGLPERALELQLARLRLVRG